MEVARIGIAPGVAHFDNTEIILLRRPSSDLRLLADLCALPRGCVPVDLSDEGMDIGLPRQPTLSVTKSAV